jgi:hypothetical protein
MARRFNSIHEAIENLSKVNKGESDKIDTELQAFITNETNLETKKILEDLQSKRQKNILKIDANKKAQETEIIAGSKSDQIQVKSAAETTLAKWYWDSAIKIDYEGSENNKMLKTETMIALLADIDGLSGVEQQNRGWLRRTLFGGGNQKEVIGERQLQKVLEWKDRQALNAVYQRVVWTTESLPWNMERTQTKQDNIWDFSPADRQKIVHFHRELIAKVETMSIVTSTLLGDKDARTGLLAVIEWRTEALQSALQDPARLEKFQDMLKNSEVIKNDPNFAEKVVGVLMRMGVMVPLSVLSGGLVGGFVENSSIKLDKNTLASDRTNLSLGTTGDGKDKDASASVRGSVDILGARLEGNWNDPTIRMQNRLAYVVNANNSKIAVAELTKSILDSNLTKAWNTPTEASNTIAELTTSYIGITDKVLGNTVLSAEQKKNIIAQNTAIYLAKVEKAQGFSFKWVFAAATLSGWFVGLSGVSVDTSASSNGVKLNVGKIEAKASENGKVISEIELSWYLERAGITLQAWKYFKNGISMGIDQDNNIQWKIYRILTPDGERYDVDYDVIESSSNNSGSKKMKISWVLFDWESKFILNNNSNVASLMLRLRRNSPYFTYFEKAVNSEDYTGASQLLMKILWRTKKWTIEYRLLSEMKRIDTNSDNKKAFYDTILAKTSWSRESRSLGKAIETGKNMTSKVSEYLVGKKDLVSKFAKEYDIPSKDAKALIQQILQSGILKGSIQTLRDVAPNGFIGLVAFNQINPKSKSGFVAIDMVDSANARIIWTPQEYTWSWVQKIRDIAKSKISSTQLQNFKDKNAQVVQDLKDNKIIDLMVWGKVKSYLSFEKDATCFNLGFIVEPQTEIDIAPLAGDSRSDISHILYEGSTVWSTETGIITWWLGVGHVYKDGDRDWTNTRDGNGSSGAIDGGTPTNLPNAPGA